MSPRLWLLFALFCASGNAEELHLQLAAGINLFTENLFRNITQGDQNLLGVNVTLRVLTDNMFDNSGQHLVRGLPAELDTPEMNGALRVEFCNSARNLLEVFYDQYKFDKLGFSWRTFADSWSDDTVATHMGIEPKYMSRNYHYVLARISMYRVGARLETDSGQLYMKQRQAEAIVPGNAESVSKFIQTYGSHYVSGIVTGDSLFQVFVYRPDKLTKVRAILEEKKRLNKGKLNWDMYEVVLCFSPWNVEHQGRILTASGDLAVENWASTKLVQTEYHTEAYTSILEVFAQPQTIKTLDDLLQDKAILQLELKSLRYTIYKSSTSSWFDQMMNTIIMILESNTSVRRYV